jgi:tetratricopeptide (TPR) repeat protein
MLYGAAFMKPFPVLPSLFLLGLALVHPALAVGPAASEMFHLYSPEKAWSLDLDLQGFVIAENTMSKDLLSRELMANHPGNRLTVSASLAPADDTATAVERRDQTLARLRQMGLPFSELKTYEKDHRAYLAYKIGEKAALPATPLIRRDVYVFFTHDATSIQVRIADNTYAEADEPLFERILSSLKINSTFQPSTPDVIEIGQTFFRRENYRKAIIWLQRALDREKLQSTLPPAQRLALLDRLGSAYHLGGDRSRAREIFNEGLAQNPDYPLFYYHLARIYGEEGALDNALKNLRLTLLHRAQLPPGEKLPNPAIDSAFQAFVRDPRFEKLAGEFAHAVPPQAL